MSRIVVQEVSPLIRARHQRRLRIRGTELVLAFASFGEWVFIIQTTKGSFHIYICMIYMYICILSMLTFTYIYCIVYAILLLS